MIDREFDDFAVRAITSHEVARRLTYTKNMLFAAAAASLSILGASAFFITLWL